MTRKEFNDFISFSLLFVAVSFGVFCVGVILMAGDYSKRGPSLRDRVVYLEEQVEINTAKIDALTEEVAVLVKGTSDTLQIKPHILMLPNATPIPEEAYFDKRQLKR